MLIVLLILLVLLLGALGFVFFSPIVLIINSMREEIVLKVRGLACGKLYLVQDSIWVSIQVPFYHKQFDLLQRFLTQPKTLPIKSDKKERKPKSGKMIKRFKSRLKKILLTFQIKKLYINIDFGNNLLTGMVYPIFFLAGENGLDVHTNFTGKREVLLEVENKLSRVAKALFL